MLAQEPEQRGERRVIFKKEAELPFTLMFYHAPNLKSPDSFALDLLSVVLAGGRSSRLYHELVYQKRMVRGVDADYSGVSIDPMGFSIYGAASSRRRAGESSSARSIEGWRKSKPS